MKTWDGKQLLSRGFTNVRVTPDLLPDGTSRWYLQKHRNPVDKVKIMCDEELEIISEIARLDTEGFRYSQIVGKIFQKYGAQSPPRMAYYFRMAFGLDRFETHDFVPAFASWWPGSSEISDEEFDCLITRVFEEYPQ